MLKSTTTTIITTTITTTTTTTTYRMTKTRRMMTIAVFDLTYYNFYYFCVELEDQVIFKRIDKTTSFGGGRGDVFY
jgi:hypothetical protein